MSDGLLVEYVKNGLDKGISEEKLKAEMLKKGYPASLIEEAMLQAKREIRKKPGKAGYIKIIAILAVIMLLIYLSYFTAKKISLNNLRQKCIYEDEYYKCAAIADRNPDFCGLIKNNNSEKRCYDYYYFLRESLERGNSSGCGRIIMSSDDRIMCMAASGKDTKICQDISNGIIKAGCEALASNDIAKCDEIENNAARENCADYVRYFDAFFSKDAEKCKSITNAYKQTGCTASILENHSSCKKTEIKGCPQEGIL